MNLKFFTTTSLFRGTTEADANEMLACLGAYEKQYGKGDVIYHAGEYAQNMGMVLSDSVMIEMADLSGQAKRGGSYHFTIPYNRRQLADYLVVDRSTTSNELSKMQSEGLPTYEKSTFTLMQQDDAPTP